MLNHQRDLRKCILAIILSVTMVFTLIPATGPAYATTGAYGYQPPNAEENGMQSVKLLTPSDITVVEETDEYFLNRINTMIDGTENIEFSLSMTSGINNFSESNFKINNMPQIKVYNEDGSVAAQYSDGTGELQYIGTEISDEINNQGGQKTAAVFIGINQGVLESGTYILEFGKEFCGNNTSKKLGKDVRFEFNVKAYPDLNEMISVAEAFLSDATIGTATGEYPQEAADILQASISSAKTTRDEINDALETGAIDEFEAEAQKNAESEKLYNALQEFKNARGIVIESITIGGIGSTQYVGDTGVATANVVVDPEENQYKKVKWESSDNIIIDESSGKWIAVYAGEGWIRAVSTVDENCSETVNILVANEEGTASFTYGCGITLKEGLGDDLSGITSLKLFSVNKYAFTQNDLKEIREAIPGLKNLDMENVSLNNIGSDWFKGWTSLEQMKLPKNLSTIGSKAFYGCTALRDIEIPATVGTISYSAFANCTSLNDTITVMAANPPALMKPEPDWGLGDSFNGISSDKAASVTTFKIPYGCEEDYKNAEYWSRYNFVEMEEKVLEVYFSETGGLESAVESALAEKGWNDDEVTKLILTSPADVEMEKATDIKYLQNNFLAATILDFRGTNFNNNNLQSSTFADRRNMKEIELPANITHIGKKVFYGCSNLRTLTIPEGVYYQSASNPGIGESALAECSKLTTLIMLPAEPPGYLGSMPTSVKEIYVPNLCIDAYKEMYSEQRDIIKPIMAVSLDNVSVEAMKTKTMKANVVSAYPYDGDLKWEIVNQNTDNPVAAINEKSGVLTAYRYGTVKVKVTAGYGTVNECSDTCTVTITKPPAVSLTASRASYNSIKLSWTSMSGAQGYQIFRSTSKDGTYSLHKTVTASTRSYTNTGLTTGKTYYYKVRGYKVVNGVTVYGSYSTVKYAKPTLATVTGVKAAYGGSKKIKVTWKKVSGANGYTVYRSTKKTSGFKESKTLKGNSSIKYTTGKLIKGKTYYFKIKAYRTVNNKKVYSPSYSTVVQFKVK